MNDKCVFINCPFDNKYFPLLKSILFTLVYLDLEPKISETTDSGQARLHRITEYMMKSKYSVHDLSRMEPLKENDLPRFNMPFECGIDFGIKASDRIAFKEKQLLILEKEQYRYQKVISDISGNDIKHHKDDPERLIKIIRDWFRPKIGKTPFPKEIWLAFNEFEFDYEQILVEAGYNPKSIESMEFSEIIENMQSWVSEYKRKIKE
jgi:hypothetical protein